MKNILYLFLAVTIFACSSDDDNSDTNDNNDNSSTNGLLVDTVQFSYLVMSNQELTQEEGTYSYNYDGNKLVSIDFSINGETGTINFTYNDNNQFSAVYSWGGDYTEYEYDELGRLTVYTYTDVDDNPPGNPSVSVANFVYNQDGTVRTHYNNGNTEPTEISTFDQNGNLISTTFIDGSNNNETRSYTYDNANSPFKNMTGHHFEGSYYYGYPALFSGGNNALTVENENNRYFYTYNDDNYPISVNSPNGIYRYSNIQATITYK